MKFLHTFSKCGMLVAFLLLLSNFALAQRTVSGTITDAGSGEALIGASVSVVGTTRGTSTDVDGKYSLEVPDGSTQLRVAYTGYLEQVVALGASNVLDIALESGSFLDEVVVIGYGVAKKSDLTGSVASVNEKNFNKGLVTAPDQLIQGKVARCPGDQQQWSARRFYDRQDPWQFVHPYWQSAIVCGRWNSAAWFFNQARW